MKRQNMKRQSKSSQQGWDASTGLGTLPQVSVGAAPGEGSGKGLKGQGFQTQLCISEGQAAV